jgi:NADP-dependent 3-hydroxy acid dehydrogenase YdfG
MGLVIIIGAGPGISHGVAEKFGRAGYRIALIARNEEKLNALASGLRADGIEVSYAVGNVADEHSLRQAIRQVNPGDELADMILYNPSGASNKDILDQDWDTIKSMLDISAGGYFHLMKMILPAYLKHNSGKLFVTGGGLSLSGDPRMTALSMGKAAQRNLVQAFQKKVEGTKVHIAQVIVCGYVQPSDEKYNPSAVAEIFWKLFLQQPGAFEGEIIY